ncbi:hypothetical protein NA57DRAFT_55999 [Rhizodiscina lignyota]|uniref:Bromo domain-containing protein n=1 Tax=Rhizodiscina lignyota TaxID=1504668 RepID=A0A9P4IEF4_9PEZI|nr:hypothetical protein NA57DRAFT_55999 [Rhizodiscina lignyota]
MSSQAYTPLESLLLFHALSVHGVDHASFRKVSDLLIHNQNIREDPKFDSGRLSADALSNFYLRLLKEEAKREVETPNGVQDGLQNGDATPGSKKRKAASPILPTVQEASQHSHLIPQLINKLYSRYRSSQIREIREQERRYDELQKEVREIEAGQWDDRLKKEISKGQWDYLLSKTPLSNGQQNGAHTQGEAGLSKEGKRPAETTPLRSSNSQVPELTIDPASQQTPGSQLQGTASMQPPPSTQRLAPQIASAPHQPAHQSPYASPHPQPPPNSTSPQPPPTIPSPRQQQSPHPSLPVTPYAPRQNDPAGYQSPASAPPVHSYSSVSPVPPYGRPPQTQPVQRRVPPVGGVELPPFQVVPPSRPIAQLPPHPQQPPFGPGPGQLPPQFIQQPDGRVIPAPRPLLVSSPIIQDVLRGLARPLRKPGGQPTRWKLEKEEVPAALPSRPEREVSPLSPPPSSLPKSQTVKEKHKRNQMPTPSAEGSQLTAPESDVRHTRATRTHGRRGRGGSVASSAVTGSNRGRTRSVSVTSRMSIDNESVSVSGRRVKPEPSTPADMHDEVSATIEASPTTALQRGRRAVAHQLQTTSRKRRRSVRGTSEPSNVSEEPLPAPTPLPTHVLVSKNFVRTCNPVMNDILSHKHASLFSNPVKERDAPNYYDIILRPQDFKSIKTAIANGQKTVTAAVSDATPSHNSPAGGSGGHVLLPVTAELVPPKAIVNSSQLEKEITRVFANAAMYNIGNDPVVQDAKEMFEEVQKSVSNWRSAERTAEMAPATVVRRTGESEDPDADELAGDGSVAAGKRRKIG